MVLLGWQLIAQLLETLALRGGEHLNYPVLAGGADIFHLSFQVFVILCEIIQDSLKPLGLFGREIQILAQLIVGKELGLAIAPVRCAAMQLLMQSRAHGERSGQSATEKNQQQQDQDSRVLPGGAVGGKHMCAIRDSWPDSPAPRRAAVAVEACRTRPHPPATRW